jgi:hypothetical protein
MTAAIWSFALGWLALTWGAVSIFRPREVHATLNGNIVETSSGSMAGVVPVVIITLVIAGLCWHIVKRVKAPPEWKVGLSRGLGFSGFALSLIGLVLAASFSGL